MKGLIFLSFLKVTLGLLIANETETHLFLANDRLTTSLNKSSGAIETLILDNQNLLGTKGPHANGPTGIGPYVDCYCTPSGVYTPGSRNATYTLYHGTDSTNTSYGGMSMSQIYPPTGQLMEQYWFLRSNETGLHAFTRFAYHNETTPVSGPLQELRTLFRPNTPLWTHLVVDEGVYAPLPRPDPATGVTDDAVLVQDTTWFIGNRTDDPFVEEFADFFTKYSFSGAYRDQKVHGLFGDGEGGGDVWGAWLVMNTKDTYFGGPTHSDLLVDGIVYNYIISNHHGSQVPNITTGLDRTFGPSYYHFNHFPPTTPRHTLYNDALALSTPTWNAAFYDDIAHIIPNYTPSSSRGSFKAKIVLPDGAKKPLAVLSLNGTDFQDNRVGTDAYQYWADVDVVGESGEVVMERVKAGTYRLTVYADGVFGDLVVDGVVIEAGAVSDIGTITWVPESAGVELWRIGTPDKSSGEFLHGDTPSSTPLAPPEYRIYFGAYDFLDDFPSGVHYHIPTSVPSKDFNYIHWSVFGGPANYFRPVQVEGNGNINNWTVSFELGEEALRGMEMATLTIQLAGAKGASGNTDIWNASQTWGDVPLGVVVNGWGLESWVIPYDKSSSCGVRSSISCYHLSHKWSFPTTYLLSASSSSSENTTTATAKMRNELVLSLPFNATDYESAVLPQSVYVQYDALRLEVGGWMNG